MQIRLLLVAVVRDGVGEGEASETDRQEARGDLTRAEQASL